MNLILGDCLTELRNISDDSIDSIVTDPPAAISFMNKKWDHDRGGRDQWIAWMQSVADECLRVLKPGAHALVWTLPRTSHWTAMAFENAGFEVRDKVIHIYGQGFPKSLNVSAAIDKKLGATREVIGIKPGHEQFANRENLSSVQSFKGTLGGNGGFARPWMEDPEKVEQYHMETAPATPEAQQWNGFGTALKPAHEDWLLLRKPLIGTVVENILTYGTGALNIDACRIGVDTIHVNRYTPGHDMTSFHGSRSGEDYVSSQHTGRFPANLTHDGSDEVLALFPQSKSCNSPSNAKSASKYRPDQGNYQSQGAIYPGDTGSAARFFYCAKASKYDRDEGLDDLDEVRCGAMEANIDNGNFLTSGGNQHQYTAKNFHPTVKPTELMRWLVRLITPPGGVVLDPFTGSGSTGKGAILEGFDFIGIELDPDYYEIAKRRIAFAQSQVDTQLQLPLNMETK